MNKKKKHNKKKKKKKKKFCHFVLSRNCPKKKKVF